PHATSPGPCPRVRLPGMAIALARRVPDVDAGGLVRRWQPPAVRTRRRPLRRSRASDVCDGRLGDAAFRRLPLLRQAAVAVLGHYARVPRVWRARVDSSPVECVGGPAL